MAEEKAVFSLVMKPGFRAFRLRAGIFILDKSVQKVGATNKLRISQHILKWNDPNNCIIYCNVDLTKLYKNKWDELPVHMAIAQTNPESIAQVVEAVESPVVPSVKPKPTPIEVEVSPGILDRTTDPMFDGLDLKGNGLQVLYDEKKRKYLIMEEGAKVPTNKKKKITSLSDARVYIEKELL